MPEEPVITVTGHEQYRAWHAKDFPPVERLRPNVWSIPVPFPDNPLRYTISYLLLGTGASVLMIRAGTVTRAGSNWWPGWRRPASHPRT